MIILFTRHNEAGASIAKKLVETHGFAASVAGKGAASGAEWERDGIRMLDTAAPTVLDVPTGFDTDCIIVLSTHRSRTPGRMLTAHIPGNWGEAKMGGEPRTLNIAHAAMLKRLIRGLDRANRRRGLNWPVCLEADHHGPTCGVPIVFIEIGNGEAEWRDGLAAEVVADAVAEALFSPQGREPETVFCVGGGHYQREFTALVLETDLAAGHMAPKYAIDGMDEAMFRQAVERNVGRVTKVLILKDGVSAAQREKVAEFARRAGIPAELV